MNQMILDVFFPLAFPNLEENEIVVLCFNASLFVSRLCYQRLSKEVGIGEHSSLRLTA